MNPNNQDPIMVSPQPDIPSGTPPPQPNAPSSGFGQPPAYVANPPAPTPFAQPVPQPQSVSPTPTAARPLGYDPFQSSYQPQQPQQPVQSGQPYGPQPPLPNQAQTSPYPVNPNNPYAPLPTTPPAQTGIGSGPGVVSADFTPPSEAGMPPAFVPGSSKKKKFNKNIFIFAGIGIAIGLLIVGFLAFFYLPNTPNNVWNTGLNRSGKALTAISTQATEKDALASFTKSKVVANVSGSGEGISFNGKLDTKFDELTSDSDFKVAAKADSKNMDLGLKVLSELQDGKQYPDVYFKFIGLKALGFDQLVPGLAKYEGKWITVDSEYIASNTTLKENAQAQTEQLTAAEVAEMAKVVTDVSDEYVFTSDKSKGVLELKQFVSKEKIDGKDTYHYKVALNADNTKAYCRALVEGVLALPSAKRLAGDGAEQLKTDSLKDCDEIDIKESTQDFDLWIDAKYKLIYKVRIQDPDNSNTYVDIGQNYTGTDDVTGFINYVDGTSKTEMQFSITTNLKSKTTSGKLDVKANGSSPINLLVDIKIEPYEGNIDVNEPEGSIPIQTVIDAVKKSTSGSSR